MRIYSLHRRPSIDLDTYQKKSDSDSSISRSPPKHISIETTIRLEQEDPTHDLQAKEIPKGETEAKGMEMKHRTSPKRTRKKLRKEPYNKKPLKDSDDDSDKSIKEKKTQLKERSKKGSKRKECSSLEREEPPKKTRVDTSTSEEDPDEVKKEDNEPKACKPISRPVLSPFNYSSRPRLKAGVKTRLSPFDVLSQINSCSQSSQASDTTGRREGATCSAIDETIGGEKAGKTAGQSCDKDTSDGTARDAVKESSNADQGHTETCQASKDTGQTGTAVGQHDEGTSETTVQDSGRDSDPTGQTTTVHNDTAHDSASELNHESERDGSEEQSFSEPVMVNMGSTNHSLDENSAENNGDRVSSFHGIKCDIDVHTDVSSDEADSHVLPDMYTTATESSDGQHGALVC